MEKSHRRCSFCGVENPPYTCPRCQLPYCKLQCYRNAEHQNCSECFYQEWVKSCLSESCTSKEGKAKMLDILKRLHCNEKQEEESLDSDDEEDDDICGTEGGTDDLNEKLLSHLKISCADDLWNTLSDSDKQAVKDLLDTQTVPLWNPWWHHKEPTKKFVSELDAAEENVSSPVPAVPHNIPALKTLTKKCPADTIQFQVLNLLSAYVFTARQYNGEHVDEAKVSVKLLFQLSPILKSSLLFGSAAESIYQIRANQQDSSVMDRRALRLVFDDVCGILKGPDYDKCCHYVTAALCNLKELLMKAKINEHSEEKKVLNKAIKKVEYLMSWNKDYGWKILKLNIPSLQTEIASLTEEISLQAKSQESVNALNKRSPKVEEVKMRTSCK